MSLKDMESEAKAKVRAEFDAGESWLSQHKWPVMAGLALLVVVVVLIAVVR